MKGYSVLLLAVAMALSTLPSGSASVLCTAPGGHMAIEDIDAGCCSHGAASLPASGRQTISSDPAGDCDHCVDRPLCSSVQGEFSKAGCRIPYLAETFVAPLPPDASDTSDLHSPGPWALFLQTADPSSPLRC